MTNNNTTESKQKRLIDLASVLPDPCQSFILETGTEMSVTTRTAYAHELRWFFEYLQGYSPIFCELEMNDIQLEHIKQITSQDVSRYLTLYRDKGLMERTVARKRSALSRFFSYLTDNRLIEFNPVAAAVKVKVHQSDEVIHLNIDEQLTLLDEVESGDHLSNKAQKLHNKYKLRDKALILLFLDTGMRVSELNGIDISDVDKERCSVLVLRKGGNRETLYFSDETQDAIDEYIDERLVRYPDLSGDDPLFATTKGDRLSVRAIQVLVKKYTVSALPGKGKKFSPHKLRSSFAMGFYGATKDILAVQKKMGHKSLQSTNVYAKATMETMRDTRSVMEDVRKSAEIFKSKKNF